MKYEYKTILGNVRMRKQRPDETYEQWLCAASADLAIVEDPRPPEGNGWELVATSFPPSSTSMPVFVAREWRRVVMTTAKTIPTPAANEILEWIEEAHGDAEATAKAKQKGVWQSDLNQAAAKHIEQQLANWKRADDESWYR